MKLILKEAPNASFVVVEKSTATGVKAFGCSKQELTDPLANVDNSETGQPQDRRFVRAIKIASGNFGGFLDWQAARDWLDGIADANAFAAANGYAVDELLAGD